MMLTEQVLADVATADSFIELASSYIKAGWLHIGAGDEWGYTEMEQARTWVSLAVQYLQLARQPRLYQPVQELEAWLALVASERPVVLTLVSRAA